MPRGKPQAHRCYNCRWWERSNNFRNRERDWGDCHFWGQSEGTKTHLGFLDGWVGASPRGSDTCAAYNAEPDQVGKVDPRNGPSRPRGDE